MSNSLNILISWFACVVVGIQLHAQTVFNLVDNSSVVNVEILTTDTAYYSSGGGFNTSGSGTIILAKYDLQGNVSHVDTFSTDGVATYDVFLSNFNGKLLLPHTVNAVAPYNGGTADMEFSILNEDFSVINSHLFGGNTQEITVDLFTIDTAFYIYGGTNSFGAGNGDFYLVITDTLGNLISEHTYGSNTLEYATSMAATKDDGIVMIGTKEINAPNYDLFLVKTDLNGELIWEKQYGGSFNDYAGHIIATHDNSFLISHSVDLGTENRGYLIKLDAEGVVLWEKEFSSESNFVSNALVRPIENEDGTILIICTVKNEFNKIVNRLIKLDPRGNVLWQKDYFLRSDKHQYFYDMKLTSDGGYIMCGSAFPDGINTQHAWLVKTNCNGEEGVQHPITATPCEQYDCTLYPIDASFSATATTIDLADGGVIQFENNSANATSRVWNFGDGEMEYTDSLMSHTFTQTGTYEVQLVVFHGMCSDTMTQTIEVINTTGIEDLVLETGMSIFPNPSKESFTVRFKNPFEGKMNIIDLLGRNHSTTIISKETQSYTFSNLPKGIYLVEVEMNNGRKEVKRIEVI